MGEAALTLVEPESVNKEALTYAEAISILPPIKTTDEYIVIGKLWQDGKALLKKIDEGYDDLIKAAHKLHKDVVAKKAKYYSPVDNAVRTAKSLMGTWDAEQEAIRKAEELRLRAIAKKEEEDRLIMEAIAHEQAGEKELAAAIMEESVYVAPVVLKKEVPKVQGMSFRTIVKFRIVDEKKIPREYMKPDEVKIGGVARSLKMKTNIPGIEVYEERV